MKKALEKKILNVLEFYLTTNELKNVPRTGWVLWGIDKNKAEKVAAHVYACQQLAYAIWSEFEVPVNIDKVIMMLAFHETEEPIIGDMPLVHEYKQYKDEMGKIAVSSVTENLSKNSYIRELIKEFEEQKTPEAKFARFIDKLECDLQSKIYDEENLVDMHDQENNPCAKVLFYAERIAREYGFSETWMEYGREKYGYPKEFNEISKFAQSANLHEIKDTHMGKAKAKVKNFLDRIVKKDQ